MDIGGRFGVGIVISGLAEVTVIKRMKIQGVGLSFKKIFKLRSLAYLMLKTAIYPTYIIHNNIKKLENLYIMCIFERKSSLLRLEKYQHFIRIPARNSSSRISNMTCTPTNKAQHAETRYTKPA